MSHHYNKTRGFTIIEMLVSISIISMIFGTIFSGQAEYTDSIGLSMVADEISLAVSKAQTYGTAVRELEPGSEDFSSAYGISFHSNSGSVDDPAMSYIFFADQNNNGAYESDLSCTDMGSPECFDPTSCPIGSNSECIERSEITRGYSVQMVCVVYQLSTGSCTFPRRVDITFARPNTEANIQFRNSAHQIVNFVNPVPVGARVVLRSPRGLQKYVTIYKTGQVSIQSI